MNRTEPGARRSIGGPHRLFTYSVTPTRIKARGKTGARAPLFTRTWARYTKPLRHHFAHGPFYRLPSPPSPDGLQSPHPVIGAGSPALFLRNDPCTPDHASR